MKKNLGLLILMIILILSLSLMGGCKKEEQKNEEEKVFTLEKTELETTVGSSEIKEELYYVLYLKVVDTPYLMDDLKKVPEADMTVAKENLPLYSLNKLLAFTLERNLVNPIPKGTSLIKLEIVEGLAIVNLSEAFVPNQMAKEDAQLAIAAIVNTLTYFQEIDTVRIDVDGQRLNDYFGLATKDEMIFFDGLYPDK